jgi:hypothetical protein
MTLSTADNALEECVRGLDVLEKLIRKSNSVRVQSSDERDLAKTTALGWFRKQKALVDPYLTPENSQTLDELYRTLFRMADGTPSRSKYREGIRAIRTSLKQSKVEVLSAPEKAQPTADNAPSFSTLITDPAMQQILVRRWEECVRCLKGGADLAAIVMMGGLLEALLLARLLRETDKNVVFRAAAAPTYRKTNKPMPLQDWTLNNYIDVAKELEWISRTARDVGGVLRDYRNYVHPQKELSDKIVLKAGDSSLMWEIVKSMARQLLLP